MKLFKSSLTGVIVSRDVDASDAFFGGKLGLRKVWERTGGSGLRKLCYEVSEYGFLQIWEKGKEVSYGPTSFWIQAHDIDGMFSTLQKENIDFIENVEDKYYHARAFQMRDPDGNGIFAVCYEKDVLPYTHDVPKGEFLDPEFRTVLFVHDLDSCYHYYTEVLELPCVYSWNECPGDRGYKYQVGSGECYIENLHRIPLTDQHNAVIALQAEDINECWKRISCRTEANIMIPLSDDEDGILRFELKDPNGNRIIVSG